MISEQSKQNLESAFYRAARESLVRDSGDACEIGPIRSGQPSQQCGDKVLVITISSFAFRLTTIFHIADCEASRAYYCNGAVDRGLDEAFAEVVNLFCGSLSRTLAPSFPHLAMSIPYTLNSKCMEFLAELRPRYLSSYLITINDSVRIRATLCMHCSAEVEIALPAATAQDNSGALELF